MKIITNYSRLKERVKDSVLAIGNFDGVHFGHQTILRTAVEEAKRIGGTPLALSFQPHPLLVLTPDRCPLFITPFQKKAELIEKCGIEVLLSVSFTKEFSQMRARAFAEDVLYEEIGTKEVFVGKNFTFGWDREGDSSTLRVLGEEIGFKVNVIESVKMDDITISSSNIRKLVGEGKVREASRLLGRYHCIQGEVIPGDKRGARLGFPTANIKITGFLLPRVGVYSSGIKLDNRVFSGITYIGSNPTFQRGSLLVESHIFDFDEDLYGKTIEISFTERIRGEEVFKSEQDLVSQIAKDIEKARSLLDENNAKG